MTDPRAVVVTYSDYASRVASVRRLRATYPGVPILTRGAQITQVYALGKAGAASFCSVKCFDDYDIYRVGPAGPRSPKAARSASVKYLLKLQ